MGVVRDGKGGDGQREEDNQISILLFLRTDKIRLDSNIYVLLSM